MDSWGSMKNSVRGAESMRSSDKKWQGLSRLLKRNVLKLERRKGNAHLWNVSVDQKYILTDSWESAGSRVNLGIAIIKRLCLFLAPNMDTWQQQGWWKRKESALQLKKKSSQISQAIWNHAREILDFNILQLSLRWCRKWCPPRVMMYFRARVFSRCSKSAGSWSFFKLQRW